MTLARHRKPILNRWIVVISLLCCTGAFGQSYTPADCPAMGNSRTRVYYVTGNPEYLKLLKANGKDASKNRVCFSTFREAENAGYHRWQPIKGRKKPKR